MTERALARVMPPIATSGLLVSFLAWRRPSTQLWVGIGFAGCGENGAYGQVIGCGFVGFG